MNKKQILILMMCLFIIILLNNFFMNNFYASDNFTINTSNRFNKQQRTSQQLFNKAWKEIKKEYYDETMNQQDWAKWKEHYKDKIETDEDAKIAINTMLESLNDNYSTFMNKREFAEQNSDIDSKVTGIGVNIASLDGKITVISLIEGGPAQSAQIKKGDIILKVNGEDVSGQSIIDVAAKVRGVENSVVNLLILRNSEKMNKKIKRKAVKIKTIKSVILKDIGYIQIMSFIGGDMTSEFMEALNKTRETKGLILDLRGNPGGLLPNAIFISNLFLEKGDGIVNIVGREGKTKSIKAQDTEFLIEKPVIILIDGYSASASEILSGALKDNKKAKLIGTTTYGKGMIQKVIPLPNGTGMNLTIAKYLTPNGTDINSKGIQPDIIVPITIDDFKSRKDRQLIVAKKELHKLILNENN